MKVSKRQFLKMGVGGAAGLMMARFLNPVSLLANPGLIPSNYLDSSVHNYWMKLTYNRGQESRETRRIVGAVLRNLGASKGQGVGEEFAAQFDRAVVGAFRSGLRPGSCLGLVQLLYNNYLFRAMGEAGGHALFGTLLSMSRGLDGTTMGQTVHQSYLAYRRATLSHKNLYLRTRNPAEMLMSLKVRNLAFQEWHSKLWDQIVFYSQRKGVLSDSFRLNVNMLVGFDLSVARPRLAIVKQGNQVVVSWPGVGRLQQAPTPKGPWSDTDQHSPAVFPIQHGPRFFRTMQNLP